MATTKKNTAKNKVKNQIEPLTIDSQFLTCLSKCLHLGLVQNEHTLLKSRRNLVKKQYERIDNWIQNLKENKRLETFSIHLENSVDFFLVLDIQNNLNTISAISLCLNDGIEIEKRNSKYKGLFDTFDFEMLSKVSTFLKGLEFAVNERASINKQTEKENKNPIKVKEEDAQQSSNLLNKKDSVNKFNEQINLSINNLFLQDLVSCLHYGYNKNKEKLSESNQKEVIRQIESINSFINLNKNDFASENIKLYFYIFDIQNNLDSHEAIIKCLTDGIEIIYFFYHNNSRKSKLYKFINGFALFIKDYISMINEQK